MIKYTNKLNVIEKMMIENIIVRNNNIKPQLNEEFIKMLDNDKLRFVLAKDENKMIKGVCILADIGRWSNFHQLKAENVKPIWLRWFHTVRIQIPLLIVDKKDRRKGYGSEMLKEAYKIFNGNYSMNNIEYMFEYEECFSDKENKISYREFYEHISSDRKHNELINESNELVNECNELQDFTMEIPEFYNKLPQVVLNGRNRLKPLNREYENKDFEFSLYRMRHHEFDRRETYKF